MITHEQALDVCAQKYAEYRDKCDKAFRTGAGGRSVVHAQNAHVMAEQFQKLAGLRNTDEAVAQIRERLKRKKR